MMSAACPGVAAVGAEIAGSTRAAASASAGAALPLSTPVESSKRWVSGEASLPPLAPGPDAPGDACDRAKAVAKRFCTAAFTRARRDVLPKRARARLRLLLLLLLEERPLPLRPPRRRTPLADRRGPLARPRSRRPRQLRARLRRLLFKRLALEPPERLLFERLLFERLEERPIGGRGRSGKPCQRALGPRRCV